MRLRVALLLVLVIAVAGLIAAIGLGSESAPEPARTQAGSKGAEVGEGVSSAAEAIQSSAGEVRSVEELLDLARRPSSDGKTFLVRAGNYGELDLRGVRRRRLTTFTAFPGERPVFGLTSMGDTHNLRLEGFRFRGPIDIQPGINRRIELVGNDIGGYLGVGVNIRERSSDVRIQGNHFHDLTQSGGSYAAGYGVRTSSPTAEIFRLALVGNTFSRLGNDAMELGGVDGLLVERNEVSGVAIEPGSDAHADPLFLWAGSRRVVVRGNRFHDNSQPVYLRGGLERVRFENNLVARSENYCMQVGGTGPPADDIDGLIMRNNTVWDCGLGGILFSAASRNWTLENNIVESLHAGPPVSSFANHAFNLIGSGAGKRDQEGRPLFVDPENSDYRLEARSPGIDSATSEGAPRLDASGSPRRDDPHVPNRGRGPTSFYDIGAYERRP
jgi:Right handed beta helix region